MQYKTRTYNIHRWRLSVSLSVVAALLLAPSVVSGLGAISQGFKTSDTNTTVGSLVSFAEHNKTFVQLATSATADQLAGVIGQKPLVALGGGGEQTKVIVSGLTPTLVSDINGNIQVGDKITASPLRGIGMKAVESSQVVGIAESSLSGSSVSTRTVTDKAGKTSQVHIGTISVQVNISYYAAPQSKIDSLVPAFMVNFSSSIAGKDVSPLRVLLGGFCLFVGFLIAALMLQAAVRSGIISIGRNPLAHDALRRSLVDVLITAMGLILVTIIAFYLVLTL